MRAADPYNSMTTAAASTSLSANDRRLRTSFETGSELSALPAAHCAETRPTSARSVRSARTRSPSPLFNPFARSARHHQQGEAQSKAEMAGGVRARTSNGHRSSLSTTASRASQASGAPPPLTREEFEALPVAIQRKYFSTLERLRFAQGSSQVDGIYQHYDAISAQNFQRRRSRQDRTVSDNITSRLKRRSLRESPVAAGADPLFYANLPEKIKKREFTREEQVLLAGHLRASVILDAADEAVYKIGRRASAQPVPAPEITIDTPTSPAFRPSMETVHSDFHGPHRDPLGLQVASKRSSGVPESFYDSFRWLEEEEDLDLRLFLDDYHSNLRDSLPTPTKERRPSFRRHLSISKIPFSRPTGSTVSRPTTKDTVSSPASPGAAATTPFPNLPSTAHSNAPAGFPHTRRKSRTMSLITPKHAAHDSFSTIDPAAAHYQDPEARLKLRVYLASPQKFDEAIEFGFPSTEVLSSFGSPLAGSSTAAVPPALPLPVKKRRDTRQDESDASDALRTFLADDDDDDKLDSDQASIPDPESPKTPNLVEAANPGPKPSAFRPYRISTDPVPGHRPSDSYAQAPVSSREMTLRMTLTRLDLRAGEEQIYGWQQQHQHQHQLSFSGRKSQSPPRDEVLGPSSATFIGNGSRPKESIENVFAGIDHWESDMQEKGVMKRFWNRVRRS